MPAEATTARTVAELIAILSALPPGTPVARLTYDPDQRYAGPLRVRVDRMRARAPGGGTAYPVWYEPGTGPALAEEQRGGGLETLAVIC